MDYEDNEICGEKSNSYSSLYSIISRPSKPSSSLSYKLKKRSSSRRSSKSSSHGSRSQRRNDYEVLDTVGCGSFAKVSRVRRKTSKEILVWKELSYGIMSDREKQMLCDEVNILRDLNHPNIVSFVDRIIDHENRKIYIVQEYCDGGDLASYIKLKKDKLPKMSARISETFIWSVTSEIASALQHCHNHFNRKEKECNKNGRKRRILHRDLKPGNVFLVKRRGTYSVKLGDFGLAKMLDESSIFAQTHVGTPYYMSPEQIQSKSYNEKSDIWSLGCIVSEMAMLSPPFKAANYLHLAEKIKLGNYKKVSTRNYSEELESAISMMLTVDSDKRAKVEELLCLQRIQFTSKMLRLDRRYCQLKKKEYQFNLKMQEFEHKFKKKSMALKLKENELKLKENELKQKEVLILSSKSSLISTNSRSTNESNINSNDSPNTDKSDKSHHSDTSSININIKQQKLFKRATSITSSTLNTSKTSTLPSTTGSIQDEIHNDNDNNNNNNDNDNDNDENKDESPIISDHDNDNDNLLKNEDSNISSTTTTYKTPSSSSTTTTTTRIRTRIQTNDSNHFIMDDDIMDDARNFLMKKLNLSDLNGHNNFSAFNNKNKNKNNSHQQQQYHHQQIKYNQNFNKIYHRNNNYLKYQ